MLRVTRVFWLAQLLLAGALWAQVNRSTITGTVTDATAAMVPGVEVTAVNLGTNVSAKTTSNQDGIYVVPNLFPGQYSVAFKKDGFETQTHPSITLESTKVARIDAQLVVGAVSQSMTVTADAPVLDLDLTWNAGISYGLLQQSGIGRWILLAISVAAVVLLWLWLARAPSRLSALSMP